MKIAKLEAWDLVLPYPVELRTAWTPNLAEKSRVTTLLRIETNRGVSGCGAPGGHEAHAINSRVAPRLIGEDPFAIERHADVIRSARNAWIVDMALCDIVGKVA